MEEKYRRIRKTLDELGYLQVLSPDAVHLVEALVGDLGHATEELEKYKYIAANALDELDTYKVGVEPYKCENVKLAQEYNDLHWEYLQFKEDSDKLQKDLQKRIDRLEEEKLLCESEKANLRKDIAQVKLDLNKKTSSTMNKKFGKAPLKNKSPVESTQPTKTNDLLSENKKLKDEHLKLLEDAEELRKQLVNREKHIDHLSSMLAGGTASRTGLEGDRDLEAKLQRFSNEIVSLEKDKSLLQDRLKEALDKQHEAMKRALILAEKNKQLEKEMTDIDQIALAVEEECNTTTKANAAKLYRAQEKLRESTEKVQDLERELVEVKRTKRELQSNLEALKLEKHLLQGSLDGALEDKKELNEKINRFTVIEHDLNMEIDRLSQLTGSQKCKIAELECKVITMQKENMEDMSRNSLLHDSPQKENLCSIGDRVRSLRKPSTVPESPTIQKYRKCSGTCLSDVNDNRSQELGNELLEDVHIYQKEGGTYKSERDYYKKECDRLQKLQTSDAIDELLKKLKEKEQAISTLNHENRTLAQEKHNLMVRLEALAEQSDGCGDTLNLKTSLKRLERENELLRADLTELEAERKSLKAELKALSETRKTDRDMALTEAEHQIKRLEKERRDLMEVQAQQRDKIRRLEEQLAALKEQPSIMQAELNHQRSLNSQLKILNEQTERAFAETSNKLLQVQIEIGVFQERISLSEKGRRESENQVAKLKGELGALRGSLMKIDQEKDELVLCVDSKTEKIVSLEAELRTKASRNSTLEEKVAELHRRLTSHMDAVTSKEHLLKTTSAEATSLKQELEDALRQKELAYRDNMRFQDDLARYVADSRLFKNERDEYRRQVEDLKKQLQQYVAEVKRFEDLITAKEKERNSLFDQFKNLSHEATVLESNNHTLKNAASQSKLQLSVSLNHISDLETQLEAKDDLIKSYEKQIETLTAQIATLELQVKHANDYHDKRDHNLTSLRELCSRLDRQKDNLTKEIEEKEATILKILKEKEQLQMEHGEFKRQLEKERASKEHLEKMLAECRRESMENRLQREEVEAEMSRWKNRSRDLQSQLEQTANEVKRPSRFTIQASTATSLTPAGVNVRSHSHVPSSTITHVISNQENFVGDENVLKTKGGEERSSRQNDSVTNYSTRTRPLCACLRNDTESQKACDKRTKANGSVFGKHFLNY